MNAKNRLLYDYIQENSINITDMWLSLRDKQKGSIYSADADSAYEKLLREQNTFTNRTVSAALIDEDTFNENMEEWAITVAESRVDSNTPIFQVLEALSNVRETYWHFVEKFINENKSEVTADDVLKWSTIINKAFDKLINKFSEKYYQLTTNRLVAQQSLINELGTPVIPIKDHTAVLPLIGNIDTERARILLEEIPKKCAKEDVEHLFIDLSGVAIIDTMVAHQIFSLTTALKLLGVKSTISGISPEVAQTSIQLGLDFTGINTYGTLKQALKRQDIE
ncbi:STAS domain-containing protein [Cytobacillus oceanisediminis]|uniref:Sulfate transporter n=1 Tax=Cytobacillus oceanisediminis 2691 TaxID=1196031 RepID=A0A160M7S7_9BACI|nr:STAS domain-containing protein [Cytobacillus oceanisediminis]MCS0824412.1 STAS domain-containing protein [Cytobacillus firmus]AND38606.1 sulfate transporter [Cytobacillus oceanisediminis 2691]MBU8730005.1 STAS domain-containing protein [Cytobacillus oceanisediminis]MCM3241827.1 STAS domain-containing protein [Cytobacillus oceanisediminis]MCM3404075.1 STAS domain-containing protein [Cytobacillus oceanisediminis]